MLEVLALARVWWKAALGIAIGAALAFPMGHFMGHRSGVRDGIASEQTAEAKRLVAAHKAVAKREVKASAISEHVAGDVSKTRTEIRYRTRYLVKEIANVAPAADRACTLTNGWVRLHDAAASGGEAGVPQAPGGSDEAASGVPATEALQVVLENYGAAYDWRTEALGWRSWYVEQKAAWDKR